MTTVVRPVMSRCNARWTSISDSESSAEVASSRIKEPGIFEDGAGNRNALPLTTRKIDAFFPDQRGVPIRQRRNEVMGMSRPARCHNVLFRCVFSAVSNVFQDRVSEQDGFLRHDGQLLIQAGQLHVPQVLVVNRDGPFRRIIKPVQQVRDRTLPRTGRTHQRHEFARMHFEGEIGEHRVTRVIRKIYA